jgi:hypothetical protein
LEAPEQTTLQTNIIGTMSDQLRDVKKVHDTYPDEPDIERRDPATQVGGIAITGSVNRARRRPSHVPRPTSQSYPAFKAKQECALKIGICGLQEEVAKSTGVKKMDMLKEKLTVHFCSQSKLSQQELSDLQKATHFDKKELQQWYKGGSAASVAYPIHTEGQLLTNP